MSFLKALFQRKKEDDFETVLSKLADDIRKRQIQLSEIRLRERRATLLVTIYTLAAWGAYISLWYMRLLPRFHERGTHGVGLERTVKAIPVFLGPIVVLFVRRIVQIWYRRKGDAEEKTLQALMKKQRSVLEEVKKKTNFYSTQELLSKYDVTPDSSPGRPKVMSRDIPPSTPQRVLATPQSFQTPVQPRLAVAPSPFPSVPPRKGFFDKLADVILGDDDQPAGASTSRYALICENCFAHNGLVKESLWADTQYICPKCKHFNPAPSSKRLSPGASPQSLRHSLSPEPQQKPSSAGHEAKVRASPSRPGEEAGMMEIDS